MQSLFEVKQIDVDFYQQKIREFLPAEIIDIHTHVWLDSMVKHKDDERAKIVSWPSKVATDNSVEDLVETYRLLLPDKKVVPLMFSTIIDKNILCPLNQYCFDCAVEYDYPALAVVCPDWDSDQVESVIKEGSFLGAKVYLTFAPDDIPTEKITIFDFLPHHQLKVLDKNGWMLMLHIPRSQRLKDPVNLAQLLEIEHRYPDLKVVVAHVGRAYCIEDVGNAFDELKNTKNMVFDISANTNEEVFKMLIDAVGPQRILFGSDLPIARMRMKRICEKGKYINLVVKGAYGDVSNDPNMREAPKGESDKFTFFMYEIIDAFRRAAERVSLTENDIEDVFYNNALCIINQAKGL